MLVGKALKERGHQLGGFKYRGIYETSSFDGCTGTGNAHGGICRQHYIL
jgi:hypothetical protein